jgi:hypothetical protein
MMCSVQGRRPAGVRRPGHLPEPEQQRRASSTSSAALIRHMATRRRRGNPGTLRGCSAAIVQSVGTADSVVPRRVFLSHTSELRRFPAGRSFVSAAEAAVSRAGDAVTDMAYFPVRDSQPAHVCQEAVRAADVFVLIAGFRYGSAVRDRPEVSYTELERETDETLGRPQLVFLLDTSAEGAAEMFVDLEHGSRQHAFRTRLTDSGVTTDTVTSPAGLETALLHALLTGEPASARPAAARRAWADPHHLPRPRLAARRPIAGRGRRRPGRRPLRPVEQDQRGAFALLPFACTDAAVQNRGRAMAGYGAVEGSAAPNST